MTSTLSPSLRACAPRSRFPQRWRAIRRRFSRPQIMNCTLIIPALNEEACIGPLLAELPAGLIQQLLVIDNGSTDDTAGVARRAGAQVISEPRRGYGYACAA